MNGTATATSPAIMSAAAPSLRLLGIFICFSISLRCWLGSSGTYIIQQVVHAETCQSTETGESDSFREGEWGFQQHPFRVFEGRSTESECSGLLREFQPSRILTS